MVFNAKIKAPRRLLYAQWDSTGLSQRVLYVVDVLKVHSTLKEALEISQNAQNALQEEFASKTLVRIYLVQFLAMMVMYVILVQELKMHSNVQRAFIVLLQLLRLLNTTSTVNLDFSVELAQAFQQKLEIPALKHTTAQVALVELMWLEITQTTLTGLLIRLIDAHLAQEMMAKIQRLQFSSVQLILL